MSLRRPEEAVVVEVAVGVLAEQRGQPVGLPVDDEGAVGLEALDVHPLLQGVGEAVAVRDHSRGLADDEAAELLVGLELVALGVEVLERRGEVEGAIGLRREERLSVRPAGDHVEVALAVATDVVDLVASQVERLAGLDGLSDGRQIAGGLEHDSPLLVLTIELHERILPET